MTPEELAAKASSSLSRRLAKRVRLIREARYMLGPQQLPDEVLHAHGLQTNEELAIAMANQEDIEVPE